MPPGVLLVEPECYPLSRPMIVRLAYDSSIPLIASSEPVPSIHFHALEPLDREQDLLHTRGTEKLVTTRKSWGAFQAEIHELRAHTSEILAPALLQPRLLTTEWFREALREHTPPLVRKGKDKVPTEKHKETVSDETLSKWRARGLVRYEERDMLSYHTAYAVLFMRLADRRRERGFLPPGNYEHDPFMYVWRQDSPQSPVTPCGLPLADDIPNHALLFTRWQALGRLGQSGWLPFANLGSVRWRGIREAQGSLLWDLSERDIAIWDPTIISLGEGILDSVASLTRHTLATMILLKQASRVLQGSGVEPDLSLP